MPKNNPMQSSRLRLPTPTERLDTSGKSGAFFQNSEIVQAPLSRTPTCRISTDIQRSRLRASFSIAHLKYIGIRPALTIAPGFCVAGQLGCSQIAERFGGQQELDLVFPTPSVIPSPDEGEGAS
ncbi:hypothetical protein H8A99_35010 [Bradyrhizobium sp. Arg68]|uniref:hypothetical protein n=1 Tax=Bradyrhizobium ivorense TaxID=2511166 RepID=UPI001E642F23|nr:hypothetical protein [Bradyrhizobium ivorense]MCC8941511.1 hypothetical protein [Bradyrhizobium ivorense]